VLFLQLNLLLNLCCYKLAYHYFSYTCWVATICLLTLAVMLLRRQRWDELLWWRFLLEVCVAPGWLPVRLVCSAVVRQESRSSLLCKDNISCNKVYILKTLVLCIHLLVICMTTWSWAYIRWASDFDFKTGCDTFFLDWWHWMSRLTRYWKLFHSAATSSAFIGCSCIAPCKSKQVQRQETKKIMDWL
jgi:hypothetical protein